MTIQWFPGHMAKARREVSEKLKLVDVVFELVDARLPLSSRNPILDELIGQKPRVIILNKSDLADERQTKAWVLYFKEQGISAVPIIAQEGKGMQKVMAEAKLLLKEKFDRMKSKGINPRAIRAMSIGIPNVGKSTLINRFIKKNIAKTGNKPGVTKGQQWLKLGKELELLDTPGILWPKFEDPEIGKKLALTGAIKDNLLQMDDIALYGLDIMRTYYPQQLMKRFKINSEELTLGLPELLMLISEKRGFRDDYSRASEMVVYEIRSGKVGRYTLDHAPIHLETTEEA
ncbi:ribosome biogenesis GTPase YlqF [Carnobacterium divergens]|uniref:Ribosome biogenesis GTPase A n=1 Tax=Carnobacterium divergens TaxID=2748 RepID=A0A2R8A0Z3_CARDV|nr:ribosome biogenesis GTPase YlqF [Carnobacterium divergens]MCO6017764.1 ribosome biogenesis GTPase YlqF [Carnobacterium divergens]TFI60818.1 ribosome biogenesis GTPase YlqF [Carnobacterium divergens]TFI71407.1 ribosome biogenesis GTPase YlqF [Carnobacterium divergens]TFI76049.1 ribosome biogenesis GTPase YlqF [Carnobacterium divergens]TFI81921.1 ribosome biogenesis GTPase YlqF [Carnobacterium divergens]